MGQLELFNNPPTGLFVGYHNTVRTVEYLNAEFSTLPQKDKFITVKTKYYPFIRFPVFNKAYVSCNEWSGYIWIDPPTCVISNDYIIWTIKCIDLNGPNPC